MEIPNKKPEVVLQKSPSIQLSPLEKTPSDWNIIEEGTKFRFTNIRTNKSFTLGSIKEFNALLRG